MCTDLLADSEADWSCCVTETQNISVNHQLVNACILFYSLRRASLLMSVGAQYLSLQEMAGRKTALVVCLLFGTTLSLVRSWCIVLSYYHVITWFKSMCKSITCLFWFSLLFSPRKNFQVSDFIFAASKAQTRVKVKFVTSSAFTDYDVDGGRDLDIFDINEGLQIHNFSFPGFSHHWYYNYYSVTKCKTSFLCVWTPQRQDWILQRETLSSMGFVNLTVCNPPPCTIEFLQRLLMLLLSLLSSTAAEANSELYNRGWVQVAEDDPVLHGGWLR